MISQFGSFIFFHIGFLVSKKCIVYRYFWMKGCQVCSHPSVLQLHFHFSLDRGVQGWQVKPLGHYRNWFVTHHLLEHMDSTFKDVLIVNPKSVIRLQWGKRPWKPFIHSQMPKISMLWFLPGFCFFQVSASHGVCHLILPWLMQSFSSPPIVWCRLVNLLWPTKALLIYSSKCIIL